VFGFRGVSGGNGIVSWSGRDREEGVLCVTSGGGDGVGCGCLSGGFDSWGCGYDGCCLNSVGCGSYRGVGMVGMLARLCLCLCLGRRSTSTNALGFCSLTFCRKS
jgi:hypothetical protein